MVYAPSPYSQEALTSAFAGFLPSPHITKVVIDSNQGADSRSIGLSEQLYNKNPHIDINPDIERAAYRDTYQLLYGEPTTLDKAEARDLTTATFGGINFVVQVALKVPQGVPLLPVSSVARTESIAIPLL